MDKPGDPGRKPVALLIYQDGHQGSVALDRVFNTIDSDCRIALALSCFTFIKVDVKRLELKSSLARLVSTAGGRTLPRMLLIGNGGSFIYRLDFNRLLDPERLFHRLDGTLNTCLAAYRTGLRTSLAAIAKDINLAVARKGEIERIRTRLKSPPSPEERNTDLRRRLEELTRHQATTIGALQNRIREIPRSGTE